MSIVNTSKPSASLANTAKPSSASLSNGSRPDFTPLWSSSVLPWQLATPWMLYGEITNVTKVT